ncbi:hypothetical protein SASPL_141995 [Salvia splendens]|uniref:Uncharacterized protein n=1 Tax=Salvia splendens TaxID=180675 RepID=A0A8X8WIE1_SALSN|nr:uncharacterized protein LOC121770849 [Salvia splendens]KAG6395865.1 hypothetical protein SASPL_141995 [Salvia splendens]
MAGGKCNLERGGSGSGGRGGRWHNQNKPNRYRGAPKHGSPGSDKPAPATAGRRCCSAPDQPPPQHGNEVLIRVRGCGLGEFCWSISVQWWGRLLISLSYSPGE